MRFVQRVLCVVILALCVPALAQAQASITGVVKDASGGVLPGVTVEASSPALIEKVRTAVTDETSRLSQGMRAKLAARLAAIKLPPGA